MPKLNILPHKSWHVYNAENRERVRRDEETARAEEAKKREPALQAESEARLGLLRRQAKRRREGLGTEVVVGGHGEGTGLAEGGAEPKGGNVVNDAGEGLIVSEEMKPWPKPQSTQFGLDAESAGQTHINLFADAEADLKHKSLQKVSRPTSTSDSKRDKKSKIPEPDQFTWYLGETQDGKKAAPWYVSLADKPIGPAPELPPAVRKKYADKEKRAAKDDSRKRWEDPLSAVIKATKGSKRDSRHEVRKRHVGDDRRDSDKRHHRDTRSERDDGDRDLPAKSHSKNDTTSSIERLRAERLQREAAERLKAGQLLNPGLHRTRHEKDSSFYHSQFNPGMSRPHGHAERSAGGVRWSGDVEINGRERRPDVAHEKQQEQTQDRGSKGRREARYKPY
ncbi:uncharacterized protein EV422DRAFT_199719 [Fimicolochytrium jonesii]|uniref:uncharacterized protein n=1 Tax=Fimicolochytrium jonesii TaxID=1396493 RepID=UPI0022FE0C75|nr:uncharacterized protein EV422DRAFT_199719 [Fimicolochytrium jonesii]KAI8817953.1 hypothetical protein EV422DRAFT_199719 [Fimicolochytrium jonesii]